MQELLWLLLPLAAASGWLVGRRGPRKSASPDSQTLGSEYFRGLDYLLNEQPDKAIESFIRMLEVNADTVETHLALGNLFRRRGEVDRAIRVHQNLVAREALDGRQRADALFELGQDYMRAGLLDRAERLFSELLGFDKPRDRALQQLLDIYQQEKEWGKAIDVARQLRSVRGQPSNSIIAHFCCELAEDARERDDPASMRELLERALKQDSRCARASIMLGDLARNSGAWQEAIAAYRRVEQQDIELFPEVVAPLFECQRALGEHGAIRSLLDRGLRYRAGTALMIALTDLVAREEGNQAAAKVIGQYLDEHPSLRGLDRLIELILLQSDGEEHERYARLKRISGRVLINRPLYQCRECGLASKTLYWQCPGCRHWASVKPLDGAKAES
jgi:lipopolysaccharide biosynthesis regulator YciM